MYLCSGDILLGIWKSSRKVYRTTYNFVYRQSLSVFLGSKGWKIEAATQIRVTTVLQGKTSELADSSISICPSIDKGSKLDMYSR